MGYETLSLALRLGSLHRDDLEDFRGGSARNVVLPYKMCSEAALDPLI
jgi:hypothetical protein